MPSRGREASAEGRYGLGHRAGGRIIVQLLGQTKALAIDIAAVVAERALDALFLPVIQWCRTTIERVNAGVGEEEVGPLQIGDQEGFV